MQGTASSPVSTAIRQETENGNAECQMMNAVCGMVGGPERGRRPFIILRSSLACHGGESGIRTHGTLAGTRALQARTFVRSVISPLTCQRARPYGSRARLGSPGRGCSRPCSLTPDPCSQSFWRRGGDSNPRVGMNHYTISSRAQSTELCHLSAVAQPTATSASSRFTCSHVLQLGEVEDLHRDDALTVYVHLLQA